RRHGRQAAAADRQGAAWAGAVGPRRHRQVRRSFAAAPPGSHAGPAGRRVVALDLVRLDGRGRELTDTAVHVDVEPSPPVAGEPGQDQTKSGRLWVYLGDRDHPFTVYDYRPDKARDGPAAILTGFTGFLQADAANVFDGLYVPGSITEVACWAHARRHFHDAR